MEIKDLRLCFLNRRQRDGYEQELTQLFGIEYGFEIESLSARKHISFNDVALLITRNETQAEQIVSGYRLYEYVQPRQRK